MAFDEQTKQAATRLAQQLAGKPWVFSVGVSEEEGKPVIIVYLKSRNPRSSVPEDREGLPVRTEYIGQVRPASPKQRFG